MDSISTTSTINNLEYELGRGPQVLLGTYVQADTQCPSTFEVRTLDGGEQVLTPAQAAVLTFDTGSGQLTVDSADLALDGEVWTIKLYREST